MQQTMFRLGKGNDTILPNTEAARAHPQRGVTEAQVALVNMIRDLMQVSVEPTTLTDPTCITTRLEMPGWTRLMMI